MDQDIFGKVTKYNKHDSQEVSPFPVGDHKATRNRYDSITHTNMKQNLQNDLQKKQRLGTVSKNTFTGGRSRHIDVWFA